ncbi:Pvstp1 [Plasmodium cynomolgi strain B]|uniref:Pvstp1 n=1 Tax=Plasmodium cynomolgi (strain B) TaxID=1120755 RepID=K6V2I5_PLACD|nr:Pvstp1 [Plasmodium cynomolgi strain B]GAB69475.1 Pvstp1 [Plasmodium cynomolgi strain B]
MKDKEEFMQGEHTAGNSIGTNTGDVPRVDEIGKEEKGSILRGNHSNVYGGINRNEKDATNRKSNSINSVYWVHWIERNKGVLEECKDQPWFHMLKSGWKQQQQQEYSQIVELDQIEETEQGQAYHSEFHENNDVPFLERQKDSWRQWVAKQYTRMQMVSEQDWFRHLLNNIEEEEAEVVEEVLGVEQPPQEQQRPNELQQSNELEPHKSETEKAKENISWTKVEELEKEHLCREFGKKKQFIAKLWMLILALVIEECEMEDNLHDKELYVDSLLQKL